MRDWLILLGIGVGTYVLRVAFLVTANVTAPAKVTKALTYVGPAVLAAIAVPALVAPSGAVSVAATVPSVVAGVAAWLLWRRTQRLAVALLGGLATWWTALAAAASVFGGP
jgi:branched-subunit amino acid transport protein